MTLSDWNDFKGSAIRIDDYDLPRIGHRIGVGEDEIHAFMEVEAAGNGFDSQGRPKMLFEPHVFYRNLSGVQRTHAVAQGLAYATWGQKPYPSDSYPRLKAAMAINETAALRSASWGLGQILGENHGSVGYDTIQEMVIAFMENEDAHLEAMVQFLIANGIDDDLRAHRWETVARVYNGPQYAKHNYHGRLAAAYLKWSKIKDTPWSPDMVEPELPLPEPEPVEPVEPTPVEPEPVEPKTDLVVIGEGLRLRKQPKTTAKILAQMSKGTELELLDTWHQVRLGETTGWVAARYTRAA